MANETHIIVKKRHNRDMKQFFRPVDKGSAKPAFCYPRRVENMKEELRSMENSLDRGLVGAERKMGYEQKKNERKKRVEELDASIEGAKKIIAKDKDGWKKRRDQLAAEISAALPTREDVMKRRVNPHTILRREKQGEKGDASLEEKKREFTIISRAFQASGDYEEANHSFLQKDR